MIKELFERLAVRGFNDNSQLYTEVNGKRFEITVWDDHKVGTHPLNCISKVEVAAFGCNGVTWRGSSLENIPQQYVDGITEELQETVKQEAAYRNSEAIYW